MRHIYIVCSVDNRLSSIKILTILILALYTCKFKNIQDHYFAAYKVMRLVMLHRIEAIFHKVEELIQAVLYFIAVH